MSTAPVIKSKIDYYQPLILVCRYDQLEFTNEDSAKIREKGSKSNGKGSKSNEKGSDKSGEKGNIEDMEDTVEINYMNFTSCNGVRPSKNF
jgi:hypothetical protein